jgi:crotonobetainyl-CoA:carnitine CoA-transferase CaiB-like acyl-CoA transferase
LAACAASLLGLIGAAIDDITASRLDEPQDISIDRVHALLTLSSLWLLKVDGKPAMQRHRPVQIAGDGIYRCRDGRLAHLMNAFPHLTESTLRTLDCTADTIDKAVAGLDSKELETILNEASLPGVVIRDQEDWRVTPQGALLNSAPAVTVTRVGDGAPASLPSSPDPLTGVRVLDATRVLAGPTCGRTLAAFGADVLHVGSPAAVDLIAAQADTGHGKRRALLDLQTAEGTDAMWRLIEGADVFSQSYRANSLAARGFSVQEVARRRPGIVYVTETAYGNFGPWQSKRGFDSNVQAATGMLLLHQDHKRPQPAASLPIAMNDYCTGYWGAYGVLEALRRRASEGGSWHVEVSLAQTAMWLMRLGTIDASKAESPEALIALAGDYTEKIDSAYGKLERLKFPIRFSRTTPRWNAPVLPGTHMPAWDARTAV